MKPFRNFIFNRYKLPVEFILLIPWLIVLFGNRPYAARRVLPETVLKGYVSHTQLILVHQKLDRWTTGMVTLGRTDVDMYLSSSLTLTAAGRGRLLYGTLYETLLMEGYARQLDNDNGYADMSINCWKNRSAVLNAMVDRLYIDYAMDKWQLRIGRQRINWGKTLVWNPNDLFNASSSFDVLYPEGPGADALLLRRYLGILSHAELVIAKSALSVDSTTIALLVQGNIASYDLQAMCGWMEHTTAVFGGGFSGQIKKAALRGEFTFFSDDTSGGSLQTVACISADYLFPRQLAGQVAILYNSEGRKRPENGLESLMNMEISARTLSVARWQLYTQVSWTITPLWNIQCGAIINPLDGSVLLMPLSSYSLGENISLTVQAQVQAGNDGTQYGGTDHAVYGSLQVNF